MNLLVKQVFAQTGVPIVPSEQFEELGKITAESLVGGLVNLALLIAALVFFFILVMGGIKWITSGGDKEQTAAAQSTLTAAIIGLAIVFSTWAIIGLLDTFLGLDIFSGLKIPTVTSSAGNTGIN